MWKSLKSENFLQLDAKQIRAKARTERFRGQEEHPVLLALKMKEAVNREM